MQMQQKIYNTNKVLFLEFNPKSKVAFETAQSKTNIHWKNFVNLSKKDQDFPMDYIVYVANNIFIWFFCN